jgi:alginate O-acetyltransferase complex protein AlgI
MLTSIGLEAHPSTLNIILPVGISFYTFQTLSYTIDCYYGKIKAERDPVVFATYVALFPQLVAGPIERGSNLLPQLNEASQVSWKRTYVGTYLIAWGLFKKVVIADNVSVVADGAFGMENPSGLAALLGIYAFAIQIYCDFSGYTDVARGTAKIMGFDFMMNFKQPYFSTSPTEFWRRWHISLSSWLRDYLYIPLGGNRWGSVRTYTNLMITMILGGLWHGAAWTFVFWGVFHGGMLAVHRLLTPLLNTIGEKFGRFQTVWFAVRLVGFFHLTCIGWLLFRAESMTHVGTMLAAIGTNFSTSLGSIPDTNVVGLAAATLLLFVIQLLQYRSDDQYILLRLPVPVRSLAYAAGFLAFICYGEWGGGSFLYFQF